MSDVMMLLLPFKIAFISQKPAKQQKVRKGHLAVPLQVLFYCSTAAGQVTHAAVVPLARLCPASGYAYQVIYLGKVDCDNARAAPSNGIEIARVLTNDQCHIQQMAAAAKCQVGQQLRFCCVGLKGSSRVLRR